MPENFSARLKPVNLATKVDIGNFVEKIDFDDKLKNINKKITSNKAKHIDAKKKLTDLKNKVAQISKKGYNFLLGRIHFTGGDSYQNFIVFASMLSSLILDSNKKVSNWISTGISSGKTKPFDTSLEPTICLI